MKYIIAIIQPDRVQDVLAKLEEKEIHLVTVSQVLGRGRQKGIAEVYRSHKEPGNLLKKVKLEIAVNQEFVAATIEAITGGARTGQIGDGKIFVLNLDEVRAHPHRRDGRAGDRVGRDSRDGPCRVRTRTGVSTDCDQHGPGERQRNDGIRIARHDTQENARVDGRVAANPTKATLSPPFHAQRYHRVPSVSFSDIVRLTHCQELT